MHALRHVNRLLARGGTLVDLHPVTEEHVEAGGRLIGVIEDPEYRSIDLPNAEACLQAEVQRGLYAWEAETEFDFLQHFDDSEELLEAKRDALAPQPDLVRRIRAATPPLITREHVVLRRFRTAE